MIINGKYTTANILTDTVEPDVIKQVQYLCNHPLFEGKKIRIQADCHPSKATVVGLTCEIDRDHIIPQLLGSDIGCTVSAWEIEGKENDYSKLDKVIKGMKIPSSEQATRIVEVLCAKHGLNSRKYINMFGTIGGGNHFVSVEKGNKTYLIIHSGSRNLGEDIAIRYSDKALKTNQYKGGFEKQLSWLNEEDSVEYFKDIDLLMDWVCRNHIAISDYICKQMKWKKKDFIICPHNYIDSDFILHKGSIQVIDRGIIPINMADGSFIVKSKACDNLSSAPHGAGRLLKRSEAKEQLDMKEYKERMKDVYSSNVNVSTIDESPMAYKPIDEIKKKVEEVCVIIDELKPMYNYKS